MFTKLRGVKRDQLDEVMATFTWADWEQLGDEHLDVINQDVMTHMDALGMDVEFVAGEQTTDLTLIFCRLNRAYLEARGEPLR